MTGSRVFVTSGTTNGPKEFYVSTTGDITIGTTSIACTLWTIPAVGVAGPGASVDGEIALFDGTGGDTLKRFASSGLLYAAAGVLAASTLTGLVKADSLAFPRRPCREPITLPNLTSR